MGKIAGCPSSIRLVKDELASASALLEAHVAVGLPRADTLDSLFKASLGLMEKIGRQVSSSECIDLMNLASKGPWTSEQKKELALLIRTMQGGDSIATTTVSRNQNCLFFENMIPESSWASLRLKTSSLLARSHVLGQVASSINLVNPSQPTLFRMTSILAYCDRNWEFTQEDVFGFMDKIKAFIKASKPKNTEAVYIVDYPVSAKDLPESLKLAYDALPINVNIPELDQILAGMKQRGRDKAKEPAWLQHVPAEYRHLVTQQMKMKSSQPCEPELPMPSDISDTVQKMRDGMLPAPFLKREPGDGPSASHHKACAHLFPHVPLKAEVKPKEEELKDEELVDAPPPVANELDDMERHMSEAASARTKGKPMKRKTTDSKLETSACGAKVLKRPAAAKAATSKTAVSKKVAAPKAAAAPKVAKTAMKKKPVSKEAKPVSKAAMVLVKKVNMKDVFKRLRETRHDKKMYRNKFTSTAYAAGSKRALGTGARNEAAKEFAGLMLGQASKLWDAMV
jgi:hypothetical protein